MERAEAGGLPLLAEQAGWRSLAPGRRTSDLQNNPQRRRLICRSSAATAVSPFDDYIKHRDRADANETRGRREIFGINRIGGSRLCHISRAVSTSFTTSGLKEATAPD